MFGTQKVSVKIVTTYMHVLAHLTLESRPRIKNSKGQGHFEKGHLKKRARGVDFGGGGHPRPLKKGSKSQ